MRAPFVFTWMNERIPLDRLELFGLVEDPDRWERLIREENRRARIDPVARAILESMYWELDRGRAFERFRNSLDFFHIRRLLGRFGIGPDDTVCEIGGGNGCLAWALRQAGHRRISLLEPNPHFITGTGYLRTRADAQDIRIENDLESWYRSPSTYKAVITRNCVHHFRNLAWTAACIRQKIAPGGLWVMFREPFVETARVLYRFLHGHPYSQAYGVFEFALPVAHYVESLELAGFSLKTVVPAGYANDCLARYEPSRGGRWTRRFTAAIETLLRRRPDLTVAGYRFEQFVRRVFKLPLGWFTRPQVLLFQRIALGHLAEGDIWYRPRRGDGSLRDVVPAAQVSEAA